MYKGKFASELSMNEVKEYYDDLRQKCPRTDEQWADFNILQEKLIVFACKILDSKTNGGVINLLFPQIEAKTTLSTFFEQWWNAPYKAGEDKE